MAATETCETECALEAAARALAGGTPSRQQISAALHCALLADCHRKAHCLEKVSAMIENDRTAPSLAGRGHDLPSG
jgi:hypothetical protein